MRCRQCGWSTSLADRNLFTGRCSVCDKLRKSRPELDRKDLAAWARFQHAEEALRRRNTPQEVFRNLVAAGMEEHQARATVEQLGADLRLALESLRTEMGLSAEASDSEILRKARGAERNRNRLWGLVVLAIGILIVLAFAGIALATRVLFPMALLSGGALILLGLVQSLFGFKLLRGRFRIPI